MTAFYGNNVPYEEFLPEVMQFCPDVADLVAVNAIRNACIEFCQKTRYWQIEVDPIDVVANKSNYVIPTPADTKMVGIVYAYYQTNLLVPQPPDTLANIYRLGDWRELQGSPQYITQIIKPEVILVPQPSFAAAGGLKVRVAIAPTRDSTEVTSELYENYLMQIADGAKAILYATPGQPYYDRALAKECQILFRAGIANARIAIDKGLTRNSTRAEFQRFV